MVYNIYIHILLYPIHTSILRRGFFRR